MYNPDLYYKALQAWIIWAMQFEVIHDLVVLCCFWVLMQMLSNKWAGGYLFDSKYAWISTLIASIISFVALVVPIVSWQQLVGIAISAFFIWLTVLLKQKASDNPKKARKTPSTSTATP